MVYGTVKRHGGEVKVESEQGRGTAIHVFLPVDDAAAAEAAEDHPSPAITPPPFEPVDHQPVVLLVDDDHDVLSANAAVCRSLGFRLLTAANGYQAMKLLRRHATTVDVVLLDLRLPDADGSAIFDQIVEVAPDLPVLLTSGYAADSVVQRLLDAGALDFLPKPMDVSRFREHVEALVRVAS